MDSNQDPATVLRYFRKVKRVQCKVLIAVVLLRHVSRINLRVMQRAYRSKCFRDSFQPSVGPRSRYECGELKNSLPSR